MIELLFPNFDELFTSIGAQIVLTSALTESVVSTLTSDLNAFRTRLSDLHDQIMRDSESALKKLTSYTDSLLADLTDACDMTSTLAMIAEFSESTKYWSLVN